MSQKEILDSHIGEIENQISHIQFILNTDFESGIYKLRIEAKEKLDAIKTDQEREEFLMYLDTAKEKEDYYVELFEKQKDRTRLVNELTKLSLKLKELKREQFYMGIPKQKKKR